MLTFIWESTFIQESRVAGLGVAKDFSIELLLHGERSLNFYFNRCTMALGKFINGILFAQLPILSNQTQFA